MIETTETTNSENSTTTEVTAETTTTQEVKTEEVKVEAVPLTAETVKLPEGFEAHAETMTAFLDIMNNKELAPDAQAQALVDLQAKVLTQASEANSDAWNKLQDEWQTEVKSDPDVGGAKLQDTLASVGKLVDQYGTPELRQVFDSTGAGNNVHVVKFLSKVAGLLTEGGPVQGNPAPGGQTQAQKMFPSMKG